PAEGAFDLDVPVARRLPDLGGHRPPHVVRPPGIQQIISELDEVEAEGFAHDLGPHGRLNPALYGKAQIDAEFHVRYSRSVCRALANRQSPVLIGGVVMPPAACASRPRCISRMHRAFIMSPSRPTP